MSSKLVILNRESGDAVAKIDISGDPDEISYDSKRHRYAICGAGHLATGVRVWELPVRIEHLLTSSVFG